MTRRKQCHFYRKKHCQHPIRIRNESARQGYEVTLGCFYGQENEHSCSDFMPKAADESGPNSFKQRGLFND